VLFITLFKIFIMEHIFSSDLNICKNILETLNLPNEQLVDLHIKPTTNSQYVMSLLHKDIPWGPTYPLPNMFVHPDIISIQWCPLAPDPKYILCGNPQAVYLMVRKRLLVHLNHVINRLINQLNFLFVPATTIPTTITTPLLAGFPIAATNFGTAPPPGPLVVPPPVEQLSDVDHDTGISNSSVSSDVSSSTSSSTQPEDPPPAIQLVTTETQTDDQVTQLTFMDDSPWAWLQD
jgi:hypothetical protein